jgi:DNA modification methylase
MTIQLHCTEAVALLRGMEDESIDLAVFDPPYETIKGGHPDDPRRPTGILEANDGKIFALNDIRPDDYLPELWRVLKPDAHVYLMTNGYNLFEKDVLQAVKRHGFKVHNLLPWRKNNATPNRWYMKDVEYTIFMRKGKAFQINSPGAKTSRSVDWHPNDLPTDWDPDAEFPYPLDHDNVKSPKPHPTAKPVNLMKTYVENSSVVGDVVLDLFMGAGSTGLACVELDRDFIGIELDPTYFNVACLRLGYDHYAAGELAGIEELI